MFISYMHADFQCTHMLSLIVWECTLPMAVTPGNLAGHLHLARLTAHPDKKSCLRVQLTLSVPSASEHVLYAEPQQI